MPLDSYIGGRAICTKIPVWTLSFGLFLAVAPFSLSAQQGTLAGTVTDVLTLAPVPGAEIQVLGGGETRTVVANNQGQYSVGLPAGTYDLVVEEMLSYSDERLSNIRVAAGETNRSDAGDSFLLRNGVALVDQSTLFGVTAQHGFTLADDRQEFTYGGDYCGTRPDSKGTIYGSYENDDAINEWGGLPSVEDCAHRSARLHSGGPPGFKLAVDGRRVLHEGCLCVPTEARAQPSRLLQSSLLHPDRLECLLRHFRWFGARGPRAARLQHPCVRRRIERIVAPRVGRDGSRHAFAAQPGWGG